MAELITLARPYAKAVFEYALNKGDLVSWSKALALAANVAQQEGVARFLAEPNKTSSQKADRFIDVCGDDLGEKGKNLIRVLAENKRLPLLPQIHHLYELLKAQQEKSVEVGITTAFELSDELQHKLATSLRVKLDREINVNSSVDTSLIGGVVIRAGDTVIDGSVRGRLAKLAEAMNS